MLIAVVIMIAAGSSAALYFLAQLFPKNAGAGRRGRAVPLLFACSVALAGAGTASAHHALPGEVPGREACTKRVEIVFWTANRFRPLMDALAANPAPCADYYISIPPADANSTNLRAGSVYRDVRDLGPQFHSVAEMRLGGMTGWALNWVALGNGTWYDAGVEFRRKMALINFRPELGHTWLLNEFDYTTRRDQALHTTGSPGYPRAAMKELVRGLYEGAPGMVPAPGIVEIGISQSHQNLPAVDVPAYKEEMKAWLLDGDFWAAMDGKIRWLAHEVYADTRYHGVPGTRLEHRRRHLVDYQHHLFELVKAGGPRVPQARAFFEESFMPFTNGGGYVALGGDPTFESGHGNTEVPPDQMMKFVSEQVDAVEFYAKRHFDAEATRRIGFSWQPVNRPRSPGGPEIPGPEFEAEVRRQAAHIAAVLAATYGPDSKSESACLRETGTDWCTMQRADAEFTDAWKLFNVWH